MRDLRLLVVGRDVLVPVAHQVGDGLSGLHELSRFQRTAADIAVVGGCQHRVGEVQARHVQIGLAAEYVGFGAYRPSAGFGVLRPGCLLLRHERPVAGLRGFVGGFGLLVLLSRNRFVAQQPFETTEILLRLPEFRPGFGDVGLLHRDVRARGLDARMDHSLRAAGVEQRGFGLLHPDPVFAVVEDQQRVSFADEPVFGEPHFADVSRDADVQRGDVLIDEGVVGHHVIDVPPEVVGRRPEPRSRQQDAYRVQEDVAQAVFAQLLSFSVPVSHIGRFVRDARRLSAVGNRCRRRACVPPSVAVRRRAARCSRPADRSGWPVGSCSGSA